MHAHTSLIQSPASYKNHITDSHKHLKGTKAAQTKIRPKQHHTPIPQFKLTHVYVTHSKHTKNGGQSSWGNHQRTAENITLVSLYQFIVFDFFFLWTNVARLFYRVLTAGDVAYWLR